MVTQAHYTSGSMRNATTMNIRFPGGECFIEFEIFQVGSCNGGDCVTFARFLLPKAGFSGPVRTADRGIDYTDYIVGMHY